ncbi:hypothetical protein [Rhizobium sp. BK176]|uniref:hypothetical protein n=1 Tax=Rhizobium sp. BK176 TaxID=2587071 RepID=UPI0021689BE1|nr:hypothetical protein [Rhizobium sp. BK176]MCS4089353.1 hypothetical protein [Rhizobium sp. BK176]
MEIELFYPVSAAAQDERGFDVKAYGYRLGKFDIPAATDQDYPLLMEYRSGMASHPVQRYRFDPETGQVYRTVGTANNANKTKELTRSHDNQLSFNDLFRNLQASHEAAARSGKIVVPDFDPKLTFVVSRYLFDNHRLQNVRERDLARHFDEAQALLAEYVVIGGMIWQPCDEPTFKVARGNESWGIGLGHHDYYSPDWHTYYFSIDEFEMAMQWIDVLDTELRQRPRANATLAMAPEYQAVRRGGVEDARQMVKNMMQKIVRLSDLAEQTPDIIQDYARLKRFITASPADTDEDAVDEILEAVDRICAADEKGEIAYAPNPQTRPRELKLAQLRRAVDLHTRRWQDRPVNVMTTRAAPKLG